MENKADIDISFLIVVASMGVFILIAFIFVFVLYYQKRMLAHKTHLNNLEKEHQKKLLNNALEIAEHERQKIAVNLHDEVGILLNVLKMNLSRVKKNVHKEEVLDQILTDCNQHLETSVEVVRQIHRGILPPTLIKIGFVPGIQELCNQIGRSSGIDIQFNSNVQSLDLEKITRLELYRLIKEVLNNSLKHAKPSVVEININVNQKLLNVLILHNGIGITTEQIKSLAKDSKGLGLKSILTRSEILNANIDFSIPNPKQAQVKIEMELG